MTRGEGRGWHRDSRPHHNAAMKGLAKKRGSSRSGTSTGGMYVTTYPVKTVKVGKEKFDIPTGPGGKVPEEAIIARFMNEMEGDRDGGKRNIVVDSHDYAAIRIDPNPTPEQIKDWWAHPNESDVKNIDTPDANLFNMVAGMGKGSKEANQTIAIVGGTEEQRKTVREAISQGFTVNEQKAMRGTTIYITDLGKNAGEYHGKSFGGSYLVKLDRRQGIDADTVVHELTHHIRAVDEKRDDPLIKARKGYIGKDRDLEEAATVAETMARHKPYDFQGNTGYYQLMKEGRTKMSEDRGTFTKHGVVKDMNGSVPEAKNEDLVLAGRKGKRALKATKDGWPTSNIAHLKITPGKAEAIDQWYAIKGKDGRTVENVQVYSPQGVPAKVVPRKGQTAYEWRDGKKVKIAEAK